ncbi:hypothetical protein GCM10023177_07050 [Streptomyces violaceoruber]|nr:hypothetical protein JCM4020_60480 [Streptomyces coelicolor]
MSGRRVGCLRFSGCERALGRLSRDAVRSAPWGPQNDPVSDRWRLWKDLCDKALSEVRSHSACWATANTPRPAGVHEQTTRERWHQLHDLLGKGVGLLECARRLNLSLNTVKRYPRTRDPEALRPREAAVSRGPGAGLHRQLQPALPQHPGPGRRRPARRRVAA